MSSTQQKNHKPSHDEWVHWGQVVIDRLTTCAHVYAKPPHDDVFIPEAERQEKTSNTVNFLRRIHTLTDEADTPSDSLDEMDDHRERVIAGLAVLLHETLGRLPQISQDMQKLLKSHWHDNCNGRLARELFRGPMDNEPEGIGTGLVENGRLPESLHNLLDREQIGDSRAHGKTAEGKAAASDNAPQRHDEMPKKWASRNSRFLRSAGQVE